MDTNVLLILSAFLVIASGVSLASFMNSLGDYNLPAQVNLKSHVVKDDDKEAIPDFDLEANE